MENVQQSTDSHSQPKAGLILFGDKNKKEISAKKEIETKVISTNIIKPSTPTTKSLQKHQLSFIDQVSPPFLVPIVYFYSSNPEIPNSQKSNHLKNSLSETLSRYYPLAGRLVGNLYVDCNDSGVPFAEAEANCNLSRVITNPDPKRIKKLLFYKVDDTHDLCMAVQATYFRCGGVALAMLISHKIADAVSILVSAKTWSAVARNGYNDGMPVPKFDAAAYFPPRDLSTFDPGAVMTDQEQIATKIFTFSAEKIELLHKRHSAAAGNPPQRRPSRVDMVSAYIWTRFLSTTGKQGDPTKIYNLNQVVNLRSRIDPPMSEYNFGCIIWGSAATLAAGDDGVELQRKIWDAKKAVYEGYAAQMRDMSLSEETMEQADNGKHISFAVTSVCGFPLYEADFGWGQPVWVTLAGFPVKNLAILTDTKSGGGIEAVVHLSKTDMEKFEEDFDLQLIKSNL